MPTNPKPTALDRVLEAAKQVVHRPIFGDSNIVRLERALAALEASEPDAWAAYDERGICIGELGTAALFEYKDRADYFIKCGRDNKKRGEYIRPLYALSRHE